MSAPPHKRKEQFPHVEKKKSRGSKASSQGRCVLRSFQSGLGRVRWQQCERLRVSAETPNTPHHPNPTPHPSDCCRALMSSVGEMQPQQETRKRTCTRADALRTFGRLVGLLLNAALYLTSQELRSRRRHFIMSQWGESIQI